MGGSRRHSRRRHAEAARRDLRHGAPFGDSPRHQARHDRLSRLDNRAARPRRQVAASRLDDERRLGHRHEPSARGGGGRLGRRNRALHRHAGEPRARTQGYADDGADARRTRRTRHLRAEAGALVGRDAAQPQATRARAGRDSGGQNIGAGRDARQRAAERRGERVPPSRNRRRAGVQPSHSARPARRLRIRAGGHRRVSGEVRHRDPRLAADGGSRGRRAVLRRADRVVVHAAQAQPGAERARLRAFAPHSRTRRHRARKRGAVGRARH